MRWKSVFRRYWLPLGLILVFCLLCYLQIFGSTLSDTKDEELPFKYNSDILLSRDWKRSVNDTPNVFCVNGRRMPSIFIIGIQKCGTTTLDGVLREFKAGPGKIAPEHHFFDNDYLDMQTYINQWPDCNKKATIMTYDKTPNYTNPCSKSAERIRLLYEQLGIPLQKLIFILIVCPNNRRIASAFYHTRLYNYFNSSNLIFNRNATLNTWFGWVMKHPEGDSHVILKRGFYDNILGQYLKLFPQSTFLVIDNQYAFEHMQMLGNFIAAELKVPERLIPYIHLYRGKGKKEKLTDVNQALLNSFYLKHEIAFLEIIDKYENVKTFPVNNFLRDWETFKVDKK